MNTFTRRSASAPSVALPASSLLASTREESSSFGARLRDFAATLHQTFRRGVRALRRAGRSARAALLEPWTFNATEVFAPARVCSHADTVRRRVSRFTEPARRRDAFSTDRC